MVKLSKDPSKLHLIDKCNNACRYLDDMFLFNNQELSKYTVKIYQNKLLQKSNINEHLDNRQSHVYLCHVNEVFILNPFGCVLIDMTVLNV